jgi:hypothetical protein
VTAVTNAHSRFNVGEFFRRLSNNLLWFFVGWVVIVHGIVWVGSAAVGMLSFGPDFTLIYSISNTLASFILSTPILLYGAWSNKDVWSGFYSGYFIYGAVGQVVASILLVFGTLAIRLYTQPNLQIGIIFVSCFSVAFSLWICHIKSYGET